MQQLRSTRVKTNFAKSITLGNIGVKRKSYVFTLVIGAINKNSKVLVDAMDWINSIQLDIDKNITKMQEKTLKQYLKYLKEQDKMAHKMNKNMVNILSSLSMTMCHVQIKDQSLMPLPINQFDSSCDD